MRALDKKLINDLKRIWAQSLAIAMVMACGVSTIIISVGSYRSLEETRSVFYERYRFASVFASAVRAPLHLKQKIEALPGVSAAELRVVKPVLIDVKTMQEPATGIVVSIPDNHEASVNQLYLRRGRLPERGRLNEAAVMESFALAHGLEVGDQFETIMDGRKRSLTITGIVLSPEFIYALGPGDMVPDQRRFGVFFMPIRVLRGVFDMTAAFNHVSLTTMRNADTDRVVEALDDILKPFGGSGAYDRSDQISHAFLDAELKQLKGMAKILPPIFLLISAFLVNMILSRLVALEREQVGLLKAIGYSNFAIGWHYTKLVIVISAAGLSIGLVAGLWLGAGLTRLYAGFFSFPFLIFRQSMDLYLLAGSVTLLAALAGAAKSIWSITRLPPAVAMRPPAPTGYHSLLADHKLRLTMFSQLTIMALRHLVRWPARSFLTTLGTSLSVALLIAAFFSFDSIDYMIDTIFFRTERQDATINLATNSSSDTLFNLAALPGVLTAEPFRIVPTIFRNGHREERIAIEGITATADLSRILDPDERVLSLPSSGLILSETVAKKLQLSTGDLVEVDLLEQGRRSVNVPVVGLAQSFIGLTAFMHLKALNRLMREGDIISGANVSIDTNALPQLYQAVKETPAISSIALLKISLQMFRDTVRQNIITMTLVYIGLAVIITFGVVYNSARIQLSERARELASLRVFGFTRAEVSSVLLTELGIIVLFAQPLGWLLGYLFSWSVVQGFDSDLYRIPLIIHSKTFAIASLIVLSAAIVSALIVRRRIDHLDLVRVLKTRE